jgi:hypothetical protein
MNLIQSFSLTVIEKVDRSGTVKSPEIVAAIVDHAGY